MSARLWRWFLVHVLFASLPIIASYIVYRFYLHQQEVWHLSVGEVLFFAFMIGAIALGDAVEVIYELARCRDSVKFLMFLSVFLASGTVYSSLLYGMNIYHNTLAHAEVDSSGILLRHSVVLAGLLFVVGTLVEIVFSKVEHRIWRRRC